MTPKPEPRKFTFDERFDAAPSRGPAASQPRAKKFYTPEEVEAAFERGRGSLEATAAQTQAMALGRIAEAAMAAISALDSMAAEARAEALTAAMAAARRIADVALDRYPLDVVEQTIRQCLAQAAHEPRVVIRVNGGLAEALKARIAGIADEIGFNGRIVVTVDPHIASADCRLEWADGGVERDAAAIAARIESALDRFVEADRRRAEDSIGA
jgi:flagellar assembly protein FliH